jgi:uncharacterized protein YecE (DUF72 family)
MTTVHVGLPALNGSLAKYATKFDLLEVRPVTQTLPKPSKLRGWRKEVPPSFVFSVLLPDIVATLRPSKEADEALAQSLAVAEALEARCIVLTTPPDVTPTALNKKRLAELVAKLPQDVVLLGWEPRGIWDLDEADTVAKNLKLSLIVDATRDAPRKGAVMYTRLRGIGMSARLSASGLETARASFAGRREVFVIVETASPGRIATALRDLGDAPASARGGSMVINPPARLSAEDEEQ